MLIETGTETLPPNPIRVETALSRYPVHRLARHGDISIEIHEKNENGEVSIKWEVDYSKKHGQPGPLAYKLDTLIINRRIEETKRPIPRIVKLGSLRDICRELGQSEGENVNSIRKALRQNAFAGITAKIKYRLTDGSERTLEADFTRYSVVFTGEDLPDGRKADAVHIILNDVYMQVINGAMTRPLDYDYLKSLPPAAQRFYELLSYQMYAAIKNDRPRAKLIYSELCKYAPLTRHFEWERTRSQLAKIHAPHRKSGYIAKIDVQGTTDADGKPDWVILYQPGLRAKAEFRAFSRRGGPVMLEVESQPAEILPRLCVAESSPLEGLLIGHGITTTIAAELVREHGEETVSLQIEHLEWMSEKKPGKIVEPAAWLLTAIRNGISLPKSFLPKAERERLSEVKRLAEQQAAEGQQAKQKADRQERLLAEQAKAYRRSRTPEQLAQLEADAIAQASEETRRNLDDPALKPFRKTLLSSMIRDHIARLLQAESSEPA